MRISDWSSDVCSSDLFAGLLVEDRLDQALVLAARNRLAVGDEGETADADFAALFLGLRFCDANRRHLRIAVGAARDFQLVHRMDVRQAGDLLDADRSEAHTSDLRSLMRLSYAVFS